MSITKVVKTTGNVIDITKKLVDIPVDLAAITAGVNLLTLYGGYEGAKHLNDIEVFNSNPILYGAALGITSIPFFYGLYRLNKDVILPTAKKTLKHNIKALESRRKKGFLSYLKTAAFAGMALLLFNGANEIRTDTARFLPKSKIEQSASIDTLAAKEEETVRARHDHRNTDYMFVFEKYETAEKAQVTARIDKFKRQYQNPGDITELRQVLETLYVMESQIEKYAGQEGLNPLFVDYIYGIENGGGFYKISTASCVGGMQLEKGAFKQVGGRIRDERINGKRFTVYDERYDPILNLKYGARLLKYFVDGEVEPFGRLDLAGLSYNQGGPRLKRIIRDFALAERRSIIPASTIRKLQNVKSNESIEDIDSTFVRKYNITMWDLVNSPKIMKKYFPSRLGGKDYLVKGVGIVQLLHEVEDNPGRYGVDFSTTPKWEELFTEHMEVQQGETLLMIAENNGLSLHDFLFFNKQFRRPDYARPGDLYRLPKNKMMETYEKRVERGETFSQIVRESGISADRIRELNPQIVDTGKLKFGQTITIPKEENPNLLAQNEYDVIRRLSD